MRKENEGARSVSCPGIEGMRMNEDGVSIRHVVSMIDTLQILEEEGMLSEGAGILDMVKFLRKSFSWENLVSMTICMIDSYYLVQIPKTGGRRSEFQCMDFNI